VSRHLFFYFYLSLFPPGKLCLALHSSISTLQAYFLLILSLIFFYIYLFCFNSFLKSSFFVSIASSFNFFYLSNLVLILLI
jgi:hypothetical protein